MRCSRASPLRGPPASPPGVIFHPACQIDDTAVAQVQASLRKRILLAFVGWGLLESFEAKEMLGYQHSGFSVDACVCFEAHDRAALERLLRYCARPSFAFDRLLQKKVLRWCTTAPNSTANPPVTGVVPKQTKSHSHHWS